MYHKLHDLICRRHADSLPSSSSSKKSKGSHSVESSSAVIKDVPRPPSGYNPMHSVSSDKSQYTEEVLVIYPNIIGKF